MRISDWSSDVCSSDLVARRLGDDGRRPCARAAAHAGRDEAHMRTFEHLGDVVDRLFGRRAPDFRPRASAQPLGDLGAKLDLARCARLLERLRVGVRDQEIHPLDLGTHHVRDRVRSEEHTSELQSLMRISYAVFCLKKKKKTKQTY